MNETVKGEDDGDTDEAAARDENVAAARQKAKEALDAERAELKVADAEGVRPVKSPAKE